MAIWHCPWAGVYVAQCWGVILHPVSTHRVAPLSPLGPLKSACSLFVHMLGVHNFYNFLGIAVPSWVQACLAPSWWHCLQAGVHMVLRLACIKSINHACYPSATTQLAGAPYLVILFFYFVGHSSANGVARVYLHLLVCTACRLGYMLPLGMAHCGTGVIISLRVPLSLQGHPGSTCLPFLFLGGGAVLCQGARTCSPLR